MGIFSWLSDKHTEKPTSPKVVENLGKRGEIFAQKYYRGLGYEILGSNQFNRKGKILGEIDFVARKRDQLVFVEVKTRRSMQGKFGTGAEAVNAFKQTRLLRAVKLYLAKHPEYLSLSPRIDVCELVEVKFDSGEFYVKIYENAVEDWN